MVKLHRFSALLLWGLTCLAPAAEPKDATFSAPAVAKSAAELERHNLTVDGHTFAVWSKIATGSESTRPVMLLVHGRTWSTRPDFDLQVPGEELSLMDGLVELGIDTETVIPKHQVLQFLSHSEEGLELPTGGFRGAVWDTHADTEYTFYGLGILGLMGAYDH